MSTITLYSLSDYNNGHLIPFTIELDNLTSYTEYLAEVTEGLNQITNKMNDGENREEWIIADYEDIPSEYVSDYHLSESFFEYQELLDQGIDKALLDHCIDYGIELDEAEDLTHIEAESRQELIWEYLELFRPELAQALDKENAWGYISIDAVIADIEVGSWVLTCQDGSYHLIG